MPRNLAVEISIGAVLASSLMSTLGGVTQKFDGLNGRLKEVGQTATVTGKALTLTAKKADLEARAAEAASRYGSSVRTRFSDNSRAIMGGTAGGIAIGAAMGSAVSSGMSFEKQMSKVGAISRASAEDMAKLEAQAKELGAKTEWSASQAAQGMQYLAMAGFSTENTMKAMPGMLSLVSAGAIELGTAADISSNILSGFNMKAEEMGRVGDVLVNTFTSSNSDLTMLGETMKYVAPTAVAFGSSLEQTASMANDERVPCVIHA